MKNIDIVGCGAIGSLLVSKLIKYDLKINVFDADFVSEDNIGRQILFNKNDVGKKKIDVMKHLFEKINVYDEYVVFDNINKLNSNLIVDCVDNLGGRFLLNDYVMKNNKTLIHTSAYENKGEFFVVDKGPCLSCFLNKKISSQKCESSNIDLNLLNKITDFIVEQILKIIKNENYEQRLVRFNGENIDFFKLNIDLDCNVHKGLVFNNNYVLNKCKSKDTISVKTKALNFEEIKNKFEIILDTPSVLVIRLKDEEIIVHKYGELVFKTKDENKIKMLVGEIL